MAKKLQLVFKTAANTTSTVSIENAKEGLTLDEAKTAAAKILQVLTTTTQEVLE